MTWRHRIISALTVADGIIIVALVFGWNNFQNSIAKYPPSSFTILLAGSYIPILAVTITLFFIGAIFSIFLPSENSTYNSEHPSS